VSRLPKKITTLYKALRELGPASLLSYARYQAGLQTGFYQRATPEASAYTPFLSPPPEKIPVHIPAAQVLAGYLPPEEKERLLEEANEIISGKMRLFGGEAVPLVLEPQVPINHWTAYEIGPRKWDVEDVKFLWEPARFGWVFTLGRAYLISGDDSFPQAFWSCTERFLKANPPNMGPNWTSAQEIALRLMAFVFSLKAFAASPGSSGTRKNLLSGAIAAHAERILPTLPYARAQNNNHLLTEAAGLYTAGCALPHHPSSRKWREIGWRVFNHGIMSQINEDGVYVQHSTNYHRLMLQAALWMSMLSKAAHPFEENTFSEAVIRKLGASVEWLLELVDQDTGQAPNLGPNDGAYIFPLANQPYSDHRPVLQAASAAFLGKRVFPGGTWDEMAEWFRCSPAKESIQGTRNDSLTPKSPHVLHSPDRTSRAYLRAERFTSRPGHADQLHLDLWWHGLNLALDAGTYLYNAAPPWENALARTGLHNTITIDGEDQMTYAGRFLWLDWAQARLLSFKQNCYLEAEHDGYQRRGILHRRKAALSVKGDWEISDYLLPAPGITPPKPKHLFRLHWLLPDWHWEWEEDKQAGTEAGKNRFQFKIESPLGWVTLEIEVHSASQETAATYLLCRAGERLAGGGRVEPTWGWYSPTYAKKIPALSLSASSHGTAPFTFITRWTFPAESGPWQ
jgi:hypothetical protein